MDSALLSDIATATGRKYYPVSSADQLPQVFRTISGEIEPTDTDGDDLPDALETGGFRDGIGNWYFTDPNDADTDGDGLSDGEEAGSLIEVNGKKYFNIISDPMLVDSDRDSIIDIDEIEWGMNPLNHELVNRRHSVFTLLFSWLDQLFFGACGRCSSRCKGCCASFHKWL